jgi:hypothetical protein
MSRFSFSKDIAGQVARLKLVGTIDEDVVFPVIDEPGISAVEIELSGIKSINSVGIREWMNWIRPLAARASLTVTAAPKCMVFQFNMVDGFLPQGTRVASFLVPFFCDRCDKEQDVLFTVGKDIKMDGGNVKIEFQPQSAGLCSESDCPIEMDVTPSKFFQFLKKA